MKPNKSSLFKDIKTILSKWGFSKQGLINNSKGEWYLFSQMLLILLHLIPPYPKIENLEFSINAFFIIIGLATSTQGLILVIKAFIDLGANLTPLPYPMNESILIRNNSYKNVRHPLYKGLLILSLGICIFSLSLIHLFLLISLAYILKMKAIKEEERLKIKFPEYKNYIKEVPAIIKIIKYLDWRS
ncbi:methyltransferase family protein [Prochlorococcus marinus]|uniref:S-isoprenylcysteine methyltransferase n=1 Tax=Prochlorococcus marinus XMU1408 TaxID=2213228 RepID=A0A318QXS3_PROMR|nr:isoprenylcysteine carboxylmethyltransferase family protein [Prochlorococcus marinus]MBW3042250.1 S-isoprenylcysteine methyltransferase [Prochlorococcus marinus str. XMU1408]PYE01639.1 S-isoprenylcysteine methyltransferase [Prochlorococcus marinus XMU1408]